MGHRIKHIARWARDGKWHAYAKQDEIGGDCEAEIVGPTREHVVKAAIHFVGEEAITNDIHEALAEAAEVRLG